MFTFTNRRRGSILGTHDVEEESHLLVRLSRQRDFRLRLFLEVRVEHLAEHGRVVRKYCAASVQLFPFHLQNDVTRLVRVV